MVVHNLVTTVDPYQLRMLRGSAEVAPLALGDPVPANSVGIVVQSADPDVPVGTQVATYTGWQEYATTTVAPTEVADPALGGPMEWISVLGTTGSDGVRRHARRRPRTGRPDRAGERRHRGRRGVAVQLAKAAGAHVVAIAGGKDRIDHAVNVLGADAAVDYAISKVLRSGCRPPPATVSTCSSTTWVVASSRSRCRLMKDYGTIVLCGSVSSYDRPDDPDAKTRPARRRVQTPHTAGFHRQRLLPGAPAADPAELATLIRTQQVRVVVTEFDGLRSAP